MSSRPVSRFGWFVLLGSVLLLGMFSGCGKKAEETSTVPVPDTEPTSSAEDTIGGLMDSTAARDSAAVPNTEPAAHDSTVVPNTEPPRIVKHIGAKPKPHMVHHK